MNNELTDLKLLKSGGQKEVFKAKHPVYGDVVFKVIKPSSDSFERTMREIRAASLLNSRYVPKIIAHNCNAPSPGSLWIIEEYIPGADLRTVLRSGKIFDITEIVHFLDIMLEIAVCSEKCNLVHRDIKPDNIIYDNNGDFWLLDFGIARHLDLNSITDSNNNYGLFTLGYASSEQFRNFKRDIDIRTDLFSIGIVCYEMIKGENFYLQDTHNDPIRVLRKLESSALPPLRIKGDTQFQLSTFIRLLGDHRRTRRPPNAQQAKFIFDTLKPTLRLN